VIDTEKPVIEPFNGTALGGGLDLALCCDIRITSEEAKIGEFFVKMGLSPDMSCYLFPKIVHPAWAKFLCFTEDLRGTAPVVPYKGP
jgi:enoyl-CoA hydratase/carnithine racemase